MEFETPLFPVCKSTNLCHLLAAEDKEWRQHLETALDEALQREELQSRAEATREANAKKLKQAQQRQQAQQAQKRTQKPKGARVRK